MRILIYSHAFAPKVGGVETIVMSLARGLTRSSEAQGGKRPNVTVVTPTPSEGFDDESLPFPVVRQPSPWQSLQLLWAADVVHLAGPSFLPLLLGLLLHKRVVVEHHGFQAVCPNGQLHYEPTQMPCPGHFMARRHWECLRCNAKQGGLRSLKMWLLTFPRRWLCRRVARNIAPTRWLSTLLELPRTVTVPHGIRNDLGGVATETLRPPLTFVFIGRLVGTKGAHILLQAARRLKDKGLKFRLKIIGEGPERSRLEAQAEALRLQDDVTFLGYLPPVELEETLAEAMAVVVPSLSGEVFGLVAAENMMDGRLLIASDIGALAEVVGDAGLRFPPGDAERLADCMQEVLESPELRAELGRKARERAVRLFALGRMVQEHRLLYRRLIGERARQC